MLGWESSLEPQRPSSKEHSLSEELKDAKCGRERGYEGAEGRTRH